MACNDFLLGAQVFESGLIKGLELAGVITPDSTDIKQLLTTILKKQDEMAKKIDELNQKVSEQGELIQAQATVLSAIKADQDYLKAELEKYTVDGASGAEVAALIEKVDANTVAAQEQLDALKSVDAGVDSEGSSSTTTSSSTEVVEESTTTTSSSTEAPVEESTTTTTSSTDVPVEGGEDEGGVIGEEIPQGPQF